MPNHTYRQDLMGSAELSPNTPLEAGSWTSLTLTYTAGKFGIDDMGGIKIAMRSASDITPLQTTDPKAPGYLTVEASNGAPIEFDYAYRKNLRPWMRCITVQCKSFLKPGDQLIFRIGDQRQGSPGVRLQTHCESAHQFRVTVDPFATSDFIALEEKAQPTITLYSGSPVKWKAILPTLRKVGEPFRLIIKNEDKWGNPSDKFSGEVSLRTNSSIQGLPEIAKISDGTFATILNGLTIDEIGTHEVDILLNGEVVARTNPMVIQASDSAYDHYWSDMHGQSGETIGTGSAREYFHFAKHKSFVDITGHQGNDFQITDAFWEHLNELTAEFDEEGTFLCLPGYEWSGNTGLGGDHNIWYRNEDEPIFRSSRALVGDISKPETDCHDVHDLFAALKDKDVLVVPHVGGRFADVTYAHDASVEPSVEVHSSWGTFDWIVTDSLKMGYRVGIVAASDGHKGRPGASYPGDGKFGSYGGLTCHLLPELTRDCLFEEFRRRHHYATTGCRLFMSADMQFGSDAKIFERNPQLGDARHALSSSAMMGDIVQTSETEAELQLKLATPSPIKQIELFDGLTLLETYRPYNEAELGNRIRIICKGQEVRGRQRLVSWTGSAKVNSGKINRIEACNFYHPERQPILENDQLMLWQNATTGGFHAVDIWLDEEAMKDELVVETNKATIKIKPNEMGLQPIQEECGGMDISLSVLRLPRDLEQREVSLTRTIQIPEQGDAAIYARVTLEDGHVAWSSPIYAYRSDS
jgi:hypothetical protein